MLLTIKEASRQMKTNVNYVYRLRNAGLLQTMKLGSLKIRQETLDDFLAKYDGMDVDAILEEREKERHDGEDEKACN